MKLHIFVHIVWLIVMLFMGVVSNDQVAVFLCYLILGFVLHVCVALMIAVDAE